MKTTISLIAVLTLAGCAATRPARHITDAGALIEDHSLLREGTGYEPQLYYLNPDASWKGYERLIVDPISIWRAKDSGIRVSQQDAQHMANMFHAILSQTLSEDYQLAQIPAAKTLRLTVTLTDLDKTRVVLNVVSTLVPQLRAATGLEGLASGKPLFTGKVGMAFKTTDADTGELLSAGVAARVGGKHLSESWKQWEDVEDGFHYWAQLFRYEFCEHRGVTACLPPETKTTF